MQFNLFNIIIKNNIGIRSGVIETKEEWKFTNIASGTGIGVIFGSVSFKFAFVDVLECGVRWNNGLGLGLGLGLGYGD